MELAYDEQSYWIPMKRFRERLEAQRDNHPPKFYDAKYLACQCTEITNGEYSKPYLKGVAIGVDFRNWTWVEQNVSDLKRQIIGCKEIDQTRLLDNRERKTLESAFEELKSELEEMGLDEPVIVNRGVFEELYMSLEYTFEGEPTYSRYYGYGGNVAYNERIIFQELELLFFLKNILNDSTTDREEIFEKRRYIKSAIDCIDRLKYYAEEYPESEKIKNDEWLYFSYESFFALGFLAAEYKWRFDHEKSLLSLRNRTKKGAEANSRKPKIRYAEIKRHYLIAVENRDLSLLTCSAEEFVTYVVRDVLSNSAEEIKNAFLRNKKTAELYDAKFLAKEFEQVKFDVKIAENFKKAKPFPNRTKG